MDFCIHHIHRYIHRFMYCKSVTYVIVYEVYEKNKKILFHTSCFVLLIHINRDCGNGMVCVILQANPLTQDS